MFYGFGQNLSLLCRGLLRKRGLRWSQARAPPAFFAGFPPMAARRGPGGICRARCLSRAATAGV